MATVRVAAIRSYDDTEAIQAFVREAFAMRPEIASWLEEAGHERLVVVKPNWIQASHQHDADLWEPVITHPAVVMAVLETLAQTMHGVGTISLCDAPHTYANFDAILARGGLVEGLDAFRARWPALTLEILDLRRKVWITKDDVIVGRRPNQDDPRGYTHVDLGTDSLFHGHPGEGRYYGADYDTGEVNQHHRGATQEYLLARTPMCCDLFVNLPKLKTHKKTGLTCCLKNLVGINGDKNWLPHHTEGSPHHGGDEFPEESAMHALEGALKRAGRNAALSIPGLGPWLFRQMRRAGKGVLGDSETTIRNGNWHGNDTCWRMALDLNRALLYANDDGSWREAPQAKRYLAIVDGIIGGEGNGPIAAQPVAAGVLLAGADPTAVDAAACRLMGFDPAGIPLVRHAFKPHRWPLSTVACEGVTVWDERAGGEVPLESVAPAIPGGFQPHFGWAGLRRSG